MIWFIFVLAIPSIVEPFLDQFGEDRTGKRKDTFWLLVIALILSAFGKLYLHIDPLRTLALLLGWRLLVFDYLVTYLLIKNDVIVGNWWDYTGKTSKFDWVVSKIDWRLRIVIRVILFGAALWWFIP